MPSPPNAPNPYNWHRLREAYERLNTPQMPATLIAERIGKSCVFVWKVMTGKKWGSLETMLRIADCLGVPHHELVGVTGRKNGKRRKTA